MGMVRRLGVVLLVLGFLAFGSLFLATVVSLLYVGALMPFGFISKARRA